jgi:hypothetical protein
MRGQVAVIRGYKYTGIGLTIFKEWEDGQKKVRASEIKG